MTDDLVIVILRSVLNGRQVYAIFASSDEGRVVNEDIDYLNNLLSTATIVTGSLEKALILADVEADIVSGGGPLPGIFLHHLQTCHISNDYSSIEIN